MFLSNLSPSSGYEIPVKMQVALLFLEDGSSRFHRNTASDSGRELSV
jgi:hypothetical protein